MKKRILGFTLIELLIVITIIGILAVVFIPTVMDAPRKARDASRQAAVNNIVKGIEAGRLADVSLSTTGVDTGCVDAKLVAYKNYMGGAQIPSDPQVGTGKGPNTSCSTNLLFVKYTTSATQPIAYGVFAKLEDDNTNSTPANIKCSEIVTSATSVPKALASLKGSTITAGDACYAAYSQ